MNCPFCNAEITEQDKACPVCAAPVNERAAAQPAESVTQDVKTPVSTKSKILTGVLALLLGTYGVDQFYLGKISAGILSICMTFGCIFVAGVAGFILGLLGLITFGITTILAVPVGLIFGLCAYVWPVMRAVKAFTGKETDNDGLPLAD